MALGLLSAKGAIEEDKLQALYDELLFGGPGKRVEWAVKAHSAKIVEQFIGRQ